MDTKFKLPLDEIEVNDGEALKMLPTPGINSIVLRGPDVVLSGYIQF